MSATSNNSPSSTSGEYSSSDEEQEVAQPTPYLANTSAKRTRTERDGHKSGSESESESESESDPEPPKEIIKEPLKPSSPSYDEDEEEEEEEEGEPEGTQEKQKSPVKESASEESEPDKKKLKASAPDQSPPKKSAGPILRIWKPEDEIKFLQALSEYRATKGELPQEKNYGSFLATISGSIGFAVTEKQIGNKIRQMKYTYKQKLKKGSFVKLSKPHDKTVFQMCAKLFEGGSKVNVKREENGDVKMANGLGGVANGLGGVANGVADVGDGNASSHPYLRRLIEDVIKEQSLVGLPIVETMIAYMGELRAADFETKSKALKIDALKLRAKEERLKAELLDILADEMTDE